MRRRRGPLLIAAAIAVLIAATGAVPATAASGNYDHADTWTNCDPGHRTTCELGASADRSGASSVDAEVHAPPLTAAGGRAAAAGRVTDGVPVARKARSLRITASIAITSAETSLSALPAAGDSAAIVLELDIQAWCKGCPGGVAVAHAETTVADTDATTPAPASVASGSRTVTAVVSLAPGEAFLGDASIRVSTLADARLGDAEAVTDRTAAASAVTHLESVTVEAA